MGMNFRLKTFLILSDNTTINSTLFCLRSLKELRVRQRKDYFFKLANNIAKEYDNVFIEDLNKYEFTTIQCSTIFYGNI